MTGIPRRLEVYSPYFLGEFLRLCAIYPVTFTITKKSAESPEAGPKSLIQ